MPSTKTKAYKYEKKGDGTVVYVPTEERPADPPSGQGRSKPVPQSTYNDRSGQPVSGGRDSGYDGHHTRNGGNYYHDDDVDKQSPGFRGAESADSPRDTGAFAPSRRTTTFDKTAERPKQGEDARKGNGNAGTRAPIDGTRGSYDGTSRGDYKDSNRSDNIYRSARAEDGYSRPKATTTSRDDRQSESVRPSRRDETRHTSSSRDPGSRSNGNLPPESPSYHNDGSSSRQPRRRATHDGRIDRTSPKLTTSADRSQTWPAQNAGRQDQPKPQSATPSVSAAQSQAPAAPPDPMVESIARKALTAIFTDALKKFNIKIYTETRKGPEFDSWWKNKLVDGAVANTTTKLTAELMELRTSLRMERVEDYEILKHATNSQTAQEALFDHFKAFKISRNELFMVVESGVNKVLTDLPIEDWQNVQQMRAKYRSKLKAVFTANLTPNILHPLFLLDHPAWP